MKISARLKQWLTTHRGLSAEQSDDDFRKAAAEALIDGTLTSEQLAELNQEEDAKQASALEEKLDAILSGMQKQSERIEQLEGGKQEPAPKPPAEESDPPKANKDAPKSPDLGKAFSLGSTEGDSGGSVNVIPAHKQYDSTKAVMHYGPRSSHGHHPLKGQRVYEGGDRGKRYIDQPSELDMAICGAVAKWMMFSSNPGGNHGLPPQVRMTDHDSDLLKHALHEYRWGGVIGGDGSDEPNAIGVDNRKLKPHEIKAVLDDSTSGGQNIVPIEFDDQVILPATLFGELFPRVNVVNITRGRSIESGSIGDLTLTSEGQFGDGSAIPLFSTASFISAFNTTIFVVDGAIEIGLDHLSDTPVNFGNLVTQQYGEKMMEWLDDQIAAGDGTTEPEGVLNASGTSSVSSDNGVGGPPTVGDYESLLFGVAKEYKAGFDRSRRCFCGTETTYSRARGIAVGGSDERRVFGMTHEDYELLNNPYAINQNMGNANAFFANLGRYRMYRRLGFTVRTSMEGKELVRNNLMLIAVRARFGGQLEDGGAAAVVSDFES